MEKIVKKILGNLNISKQDSKLIGEIISRNKSEIEKILEKEIHSHLKYLNISVEKSVETEKVFEQNENQNETNFNQDHLGNHSNINNYGGQNYGN